MKKQATVRKVKSEGKHKDFGAIREDLFHQISSSMVSLEGYLKILSQQYSNRLDQKGKHYVRRILSNAEDVHLLVRMLKECLNGYNGYKEKG